MTEPNAAGNANVIVDETEPDAYARRLLTVDFLFLDRERCGRCIGTGEALEAALDRIADLLDDLGVEVVVRHVHVDSAAAARQTDLEVSPTVRTDGQDVQPDWTASPCESCEVSPSDDRLECRDWRYRGRTHATPPVELLIEALLRRALEHRSRGEPAGGTDRNRTDVTFRESAFGDPPDDSNGCSC